MFLRDLVKCIIIGYHVSFSFERYFLLGVPFTRSNFNLDPSKHA